MLFSKNVNKKNVLLLRLVFFNEKKLRNFYKSPFQPFSKFNNFLWICRFLVEQNSFQFCTPAWKLDNPYYHNMYMHWLDFIAYKNEIIRFTFGLLALFSTMFSSFRAVINKKRCVYCELCKTTKSFMKIYMNFDIVFFFLIWETSKIRIS